MNDIQPHWMISPTQISIDEGRPLGTGGFGTVYRGVWEGADVAVKRLVDETSDQIFMKQVKLWLELRHPHVLQLFGASNIDFKPLYFVTQYFRHGNVNQYLSKSEVSGRERSKLVHEIALGMQYLHGRKIIHGDLKPANILVSDNLQACIADFGLSEMKLDSNDRSSIGGGRRDMAAGSPRYFSPEAWKGQISSSSDVFAFAMTAFEVFSSTPPWGILSSTHIYQLVVRENERPDRPDGDSPSDAEWALIEQAWQRDGHARPKFEYLARNWPLVDPESVQASSVENATGTIPEPSTPERNTAYQYSMSMGLASPISPIPRGLTTSPAPAYEQAPGPVTAGLLQNSSSRGSGIRSLPSPPPTAPGDRLVRMSMVSHNSEGSWVSMPQTPFQTSSTIFQPSPTSYLQRAPGIMTIHEDGSVGSSYMYTRSASMPNPRDFTQMTSPEDVGSSTGRRWGSTQETIMAQPTGQRQVSATLLAGALQSAAVESRQQSTIDEHLVDVQKLAASSEKEAQRLITAGIISTLTILLRERSVDSIGLDLVLKALGTLTYDLLTANTLNRTGSTKILMEVFQITIDENIALLSLWCLGRMTRSSEIATNLIKLDFLPPLIKFGFTHPYPNREPLRARLAAWCIGNLARSDALASTVIDRPIVAQSLAAELQHMNANSAPTDISAILYAIARLSRTIPNSKVLARAGCVSLVVNILLSANDANVLCWCARAVGCLMRPNSGDMSKALLDAGAARGLARLPRAAPDAMLSLQAFAFAIQRFSCAEWGSGTRKALVEAGVVDSLLAALRTAAEVRSPQTHIELALAVSFLGDVGGGPIRKEIISASGIDILKRVAAEGSSDVAKACGVAITSITGNVFTRNAASARTAMAHNWNGGCPDYQLGYLDVFPM